MNEKHALLVILDGWGISSDEKISAVAQANTPFMDHLCKNYPNSKLVTYGEEVGLPPGQMGNSEVGHLNNCKCDWSILCHGPRQTLGTN